MSIRGRLNAVEQGIRNHTGGIMTVFFKDGSTKRIHPGQAVPLSLEEGERIDRFEEEPGGSNDGVIEGLANALLIPGVEERKDGTL